jgi:nicotinamide-nucleotide amidase
MAERIPMRAPSDAELRELAMQVGAHLGARGERVVTVESCTGGWIAKTLTDVSGSSGWVDGGLVTYSNGAKEALVGVESRTLEAHGAVSEETVREMAAGALERTDASRVVAVSGVAGPTGGTAEKPVGLVWLAWGERNGAETRLRTRRVQLAGDRETIRRLSVALALEGLLEDEGEGRG